MKARLFLLLASLFGVAACGSDGPDSASSSGGAAASASASEGAGGSTASAGGSTAESGAGGQGGGAACTEVTLGELILSDTEPGGSSLAYALTGLSKDQEHALYIEFFDVAGPQTAGSFDLSSAPDDNYSTCGQCLLAFEDVNGESVPYFPESGTLEVTKPDVNYTGASAGSLKSIKLIEVTLEKTKTTPVPGGKCLSLSGAWEHTP